MNISCKSGEIVRPRKTKTRNAGVIPERSAEGAGHHRSHRLRSSCSEEIIHPISASARSKVRMESGTLRPSQISSSHQKQWYSTSLSRATEIHGISNSTSYDNRTVCQNKNRSKAGAEAVPEANSLHPSHTQKCPAKEPHESSPDSSDVR